MTDRDVIKQILKAFEKIILVAHIGATSLERQFKDDALQDVDFASFIFTKYKHYLDEKDPTP